MAITYGKIQAYGSLAIAADTDNSGDEYITLTVGKGLSGGTADGLTIYQNHLTWLNYPVSTYTDVWIDASGLDQNTYYPVLCWVPQMGLHRFRLSVQLNGGGNPSWSTHNAGFTCNIDVMLNYAGWGTTSHLRYIKLQDDYNFATVKPAYFAGQGYTSSNVCFMVRGGGIYRFITDHPTTFSLKTSSTTVNNETFSPTTSTSVWYSGQYADIATNILGSANYASSAGNADTLDGYHYNSFAWASHSHDYLPRSGGSMNGALTFANNTWNLLGDDVWFGDANAAGAFCIKGANGTTNLKFYQYDGSGVGTISFDAANNFNVSHYIIGTISSATNADSVDGVHASSMFLANGWWSSDNTAYNADSVGIGMTFAYSGVHNVPENWGTLCTFGYGSGRDYNLQLHGTGTNRLYYRNRSSDFGQGGWQRVQVIAGYGTSRPQDAGITAANYGDVYYQY